MDFMSEYAYDYGFDGSEDEEVEDEVETTKEKIKRKMRKADANIISIRFDKLIESNESFPGEPLFCKNCEAALSTHSLPSIKQENDQKLWTCEFCYHINDLTSTLSTLDEIPSKNDTTYLLEPAPAITGDVEITMNENTLDRNFLTFCIDNSGSMNFSIGNAVNNIRTRLDAVKVACFENINKLKTETPSKRVNLVTFSSVVNYYGDCTNLPNNYPLVSLSDNTILNDKEKLIEKGSEQSQEIQPISSSNAFLQQRIQFIKTEGCTALGPALAFSIGLSGKIPGSQVILCTDGCANVGIGNVERTELSEAEQFYEKLAEEAKERKLTINVISMQGTDCKLSLLGKLADLTNGSINIVNPLNLSDQFKSILDNRIIATNVKAKLIVNQKYLYIRDADYDAAEGKAIESGDSLAKEAILALRRSTLLKEIGNANIDTEITLEYGIRKLSKDDEKIELNELPFQLQIEYTAPNGSKFLRIYTKKQKFTKNRKEAEKKVANVDIYWTHANSKISNQMVLSNVGIAKMQMQQQQQMQATNLWSKPESYSRKERIVQRVTKSTRLAQMNDEDASEMFSGKKISRNKIHEEKK